MGKARKLVKYIMAECKKGLAGDDSGFKQMVTPDQPF